MHIPDGMMEGPVCPITTIAATAGVVASAIAASRNANSPTPTSFASVSAFLFAAQMLNFPVSGGTSGHLIGGVLASAVLGVPFGILAITLVLVVQCLIFADGGLSVLGANVVNMAIIGAGLGGMLAGGAGPKTSAHWARLGFAAWASVMLAAFSTCLMLAWAGASPLPRSLPPMLGIHALIGIGEAALTVAIVKFLPSPAEGKARGIGAWALAAVLAAIILAPLASPLPDGLEWAAEIAGFAKSVEPPFVAPLPNYEVRGLHPWLSTAAAGVLGILATGALGLTLARVLPRGARS